jgi:type I restriction enzyme, S subunit
MRKYPKYKPSGIDWIGNIPEHWEVKKIKYLFKDHSGNGFPEEHQGMTDGDFPFYKVSDINQSGMYVKKSNNYVSKEEVAEHGWNIIPQYSILAAKIGEALRKNHRKINVTKCIIDNNCIALAPVYIEREYAYYLLTLIDFDWFTNPGAVPSVSSEKLKSFFVLHPTTPEQTVIANFLDKKTVQIDKLITNKQKLIELLKEERTAIINQAVTLGIDPKVKLKPSGIDWLGDIPVHWEVKKLKYITIINSESLSENEDDNLFFNYIDISSVDSDGNIISTTEYLYVNAPSRARRIVRKGDTILSTVRTYLKAIAFINDVSQNMICSTGFAVIRPLELFTPKFMYYICRSQIINEIVMSLSKGVSYPAIDSEDFKNIFIWFPDKTEQDKIVQHIETETKRLDSTISKIEKEIELLQEYRTALISEVVTGKIKVI